MSDIAEILPLIIPLAGVLVVLVVVVKLITSHYLAKLQQSYAQVSGQRRQVLTDLSTARKQRQKLGNTQAFLQRRITEHKSQKAQLERQLSELRKITGTIERDHERTLPQPLE